MSSGPVVVADALDDGALGRSCIYSRNDNLWSRSGRQSELGKKERMIPWQFRTGVAPSGDHE